MSSMTQQNKKTIFEFWNRFTTSQKWLFFIIFSILIAGTLPLITLIFIGMLPTITIILTDMKNTSKIIIVGSCNIAGVLVYLIKIFDNFSFEYALMLSTNILNLIVMFGSAALGLIMYRELPNLFIFLAHAS